MPSSGVTKASRNTPGKPGWPTCHKPGWFPISTKLDDIEGELQQGVARSLYQSRPQRLRRIAATALLTLKHTLRGMLFSWPLYLLGFGAFALPLNDAAGHSWDGGWSGAWLLPLLLPGLIVSFSILKKGIQEDYRSCIHRTLLDWQDVRQLLKKGAP